MHGAPPRASNVAGRCLKGLDLKLVNPFEDG